MSYSILMLFYYVIETYGLLHVGNTLDSLSSIEAESSGGSNFEDGIAEC